MPKPSLERCATAIGDPLLSDNYQFHFPRIPIGNGDGLLLHCKSATKPGMTINPVEAQLYGHTIEYAGNLTYGHDLAVSYIENSRMDNTVIMEDWSEYVKSHKSQHGAFKAQYAVPGYLTVFNIDGSVVREYVIYNCWPAQVPDTAFDGSSSSLLTLDMSFKYDWYERRR